MPPEQRGAEKSLWPRSLAEKYGLCRVWGPRLQPHIGLPCGERGPQSQRGCPFPGACLTPLPQPAPRQGRAPLPALVPSAEAPKP